MKKFCLYFLIFVCSLTHFYSQTNVMPINGNWQFKQKGTTSWNKASIPGNVYTDLFQNNLIPDPFFSNNEQQVQWVENEDWEYKTTFVCPKALLTNVHQELIFEGLDTYAKVYLNDSLILVADNMFRSWKVEVKKQLRLGKNTLTILFQSAAKKGKSEVTKLPYTLPEAERVVTRKAQFQYGWDFGPRFVGCGIWKPISLKCWSGLQLENLKYQVSAFNDSLATIQFIVKSMSDKEGDFEIQVSENNLKTDSLTVLSVSKFVHFKKGANLDTIEIKLRKPKLWWCNGLGSPYLYNFNCFIRQNKILKASQTVKVGIRTIEWVFNPDSLGTSFYAKVNGKPVFMKGANYIPSSIFLKQKNTAEYLHEIEVYKNSNFNMLRVWGGGVYGDDAFYNACDEKGILVWQDFMFACAMYPGDNNFLSNVKAEIKEQIIRLQNHPSLALWCGNNEVQEGWDNWGWQKQFAYSKGDSTKIWKDYESLFQKSIPKILGEENCPTQYLSTSPLIGWGHKESLTKGDSHYWGVWWGMEPFENYEKKVGRFVTEYGFQSLPTLSTFKTFCASDELNLKSISVKSHQKHKTGYETIQTYLERDYKTPSAFDHSIYVSQLVQRDGMKMAIEAHRSSKPQCMGTLFWQLNDCWPGVSWSAIDYFGKPKALMYCVKRLFKTVLITAKQQQGDINCFIVSDSIHEFNGQLKLQLLSFNDSVLWQKMQDVFVTNSKVGNCLIKSNELPNFDSTACYLKMELAANELPLATNFYFFAKAKFLKLPKATLLVRKLNYNTFEVSSNVFVKDVYLFSENDDVLVSDNFFDLQAGQKKKIKISEFKGDPVNLKLKALTLNNL